MSRLLIGKLPSNDLDKSLVKSFFTSRFDFYSRAISIRIGYVRSSSARNCPDLIGPRRWNKVHVSILRGNLLMKSISKKGRQAASESDRVHPKNKSLSCKTGSWSCPTIIATAHLYPHIYSPFPWRSVLHACLPIPSPMLHDTFLDLSLIAFISFFNKAAWFLQVFLICK